MRALRPTLQAKSRELESLTACGAIPPWQPIATRQVANLLGISVQVLANWRVRDNGPPSRPSPRGGGNRRLYCMGEVLAWITGREPWTFSRDWLLAHGIADEDCSEADVILVIGLLTANA